MSDVRYEIREKPCRRKGCKNQIFFDDYSEYIPDFCHHDCREDFFSAIGGGDVRRMPEQEISGAILIGKSNEEPIVL